MINYCFIIVSEYLHVGLKSRSKNNCVCEFYGISFFKKFYVTFANIFKPKLKDRCQCIE